MPITKKPTLERLARKYSKYICASHCTIIEAAKHFRVPKSTLWYRLELLSPKDRAPTKRIARENIHHQKHSKRRKQNVSRNRRRR